MHSIGNQLILSSKKSKSMIAYLTHADLVQCEVIVIERMSVKQGVIYHIKVLDAQLEIQAKGLPGESYNVHDTCLI